jgi:hypothetical protein
MVRGTGDLRSTPEQHQRTNASAVTHDSASSPSRGNKRSSYIAVLTSLPGGTMKIVWLLLAVLLTCLTIGGLVSAAKGTDTQSVVGDLIISALLGWGAVGSWKRTSR